MEWFFYLVIGAYLGGSVVLFLAYRAARPRSMVLKAWED